MGLKMAFQWESDRDILYGTADTGCSRVLNRFPFPTRLGLGIQSQQLEKRITTRQTLGKQPEVVTCDLFIGWNLVPMT